MSRFVLGLDPGPPGDHTGLAVIEQTDDRICVVRHVERFRPGAPYQQIAESVERIISETNLPHPPVLTDQTAVGSQVVGLFRDVIRSGRVRPVVITNGTGESTVGSAFGLASVPKKELVGGLQLVLQGRRLKIPVGLALAELLSQELSSFRAKVVLSSAADMDWRERPHDDLVLATALAVWHAERYPPYRPDSISHSEPSETQRVLDMLFPDVGGWPW